MSRTNEPVRNDGTTLRSPYHAEIGQFIRLQRVRPISRTVNGKLSQKRNTALRQAWHITFKGADERHASHGSRAYSTVES